MSPVDVLDIVNYGLVFVYGLFLSASIAGGCKARRERVLLYVAGSVLLLLLGGSWLTLGLKATKQLYPVLVHLPTIGLLAFAFKKPVGISLVSVCTAYLCCQLPRCGEMAMIAVTGSELMGEIFYTVIIFPIFLLLYRYFAPSAREAIGESRKALLLFGSLPVTFYIFSFAAYIYTDFFHFDSYVVAEMLPIVAGLFYMIYTTAYRQQLQRRTQAELLDSLMGGQLKQAENDMVSLHQAEAQSAAYQHDMRHHLAVIDGFLAIGKPEQAQEYIRQVQDDIEAITPKRFCENELVNLLCSSFSGKAGRMGVRLNLETSLPGKLAISDTELCALLSNGLENALNAVKSLEEERRWVELYCGVHLDKLLIEIKNPYSGRVAFREGVPTASKLNHGYGCQSIHTISQRCHGLCEFKAENGIFTMRVALPML